MNVGLIIASGQAVLVTDILGNSYDPRARLAAGESSKILPGAGQSPIAWCRDFETYLIPTEAFATLQEEPLPLDIATDLSQYMDERRECLQAKMDEVATKARKNELVDVSLADDVLRISPLKKATPPSAVAFAEKAYSLIPSNKA